MADEIITAFKLTDPAPSGAIEKYLVYYNLDDGVRTTQVEITVDASQMIDPTDLDELEVVANKSAALLKATWTNSFKTTLDATEEPTVSGVVTL